MEPQTLAERNDFQTRFNPQDYLSSYYATPGTPENAISDFSVKNVHKAFCRLISEEQKVSSQSDKIRVLDYGCGPSICYTISAAGIPNVSEIVLAEYTVRNREAVQQWLDKDPSGFDWSPYFKYVVQTLEGKAEEQVTEREERMRRLVKVVPCDITLDPPIEKGYEGPYDIVLSSLCLESSCENVDEYRAGVAKLSSLLKPGGLLLICSTEKQQEEKPSYYLVGSQYFYDLKFSYDDVVSSIKEAGLSFLSVDHLEVCVDPAIYNSPKYMFICAEKNKI